MALTCSRLVPDRPPSSTKHRRRGITLAVLLGSQSRCYIHPASLLVVSSLIGPLAVTTTTTATVARVAFALPAACASAAAAYHQPPQPPQQQQQQRRCPSPGHHQDHKGRRRRGRRPAMAHLLSSSATSESSSPSLGDAATATGSAAAAAAAAAAASSAAPTSLEALQAVRKGSAGSGSGLELDGVHMRRALELAARGLGRTRPNPAVGCVILDKDGLVVGEGYHPRAGEPHAEVRAGTRGGGGELRPGHLCVCVSCVL